MKRKAKHHTALIAFVILGVCLITGCAKTPKNTAPVQSGEIILIVNGDDVGITSVFTDATLKALLDGNISSSSICSGSHDADRAIQLWKQHPELSIGIHLTLTGDWKPLTPRETAPSLYSNAGTFWNTSEEARRNVKPEHAKTEWEAQILKIKNSGIKISHLDSHMGCYFLSPELFSAAFELSRQYHLPLMAAYNPAMPVEWKASLPITSYTGIYNIPGRQETLANRTEAYYSMLSGLKPGIHYFFTHQGILPEGQKPYGDLDIRIDDYKFWSNQETTQRLHEMGIAIKPFSALQDLFRAVYK